MKKNKILLIAAVACTSMFSSCSDLLDLYPEDSLSDPNSGQVYKTLNFMPTAFTVFYRGRRDPVPMMNRTVT